MKELFSYNALTGDLIRKTAPCNSVKIGDVAGYKSSTGYIFLKVDGDSYTAHRIIWLWLFGRFPLNDIDHINHVKDDNRLINLRDATRTENLKNQKIRKNNTSGVMGVSWINRDQKWCAKIAGIRLGHYKSFEEAVSVRRRAEIELDYHENHNREIA